MFQPTRPTTCDCRLLDHVINVSSWMTDAKEPNFNSKVPWQSRRVSVNWWRSDSHHNVMFNFLRIRFFFSDICATISLCLNLAGLVFKKNDWLVGNAKKCRTTSPIDNGWGRLYYHQPEFLGQDHLVEFFILFCCWKIRIGSQTNTQSISKVSINLLAFSLFRHNQATRYRTQGVSCSWYRTTIALWF